MLYFFIKDDYKLIDQQKVLLKLFELMKEHDGFTPKEFKPRADELYRYCWKVKREHETIFEIVQINQCLYLTADTKFLQRKMS